MLESIPTSDMSVSDLVALATIQLRVGATESAASNARKILAIDELEPDIEAKAGLVLARCLAINKRFGEATGLLDDIWARTGNLAVARGLLMVLRTDGSREQVDAVKDEVRRTHVASLPSDLASGLASIARINGPDLQKAPKPLVIPWKLSERPEHEWSDWSSRALWGKQAVSLLARWGHFAGLDRGQELLDLVDPIDYSPLQEALSLGRGVILFGTHMGPVAAAFFALEEQFGSRFAFLGAGGNAASTKAKQILLSDSGQHGGVTQMIRHLKHNGVLAISNDATNSGAFRKMTFAGYDCKMSRLTPRLSRAQSTPSFWYQPEWVGDRLQVKFKSMPEYKTGETIPAWEDRWYAAAKEHITSFAKTAAENQSGFSMYSNPLGMYDRDWWGG
ncbi:hypothetical protein [Shimia sp. SK013]|uniref:hypothetical protein n=1 Tax=Shimia sp. SK013 TaxID=1389006 RepID=UPI00187C0180|nr:hypothetical protein [Shimia sp. SK013]